MKAGKWMICAMALLLWMPHATPAAEKDKAAEATLEAPKAKAKASEPALATPKARFSYAMGMEIGAAMRNLKDEVDMEAMIRGLQDSFGEKQTLLTKEEAVAIRKEFNKKLQHNRAELLKQFAAKNLKAQEEFLAENKKRKGVITTKSGLQYEVLKQGDGPRPQASNRVKAHYKGALLDKSVFDSSYDRGKPTVFAVNKVIPGWREALPLMRVGGKYRLYIPSRLAYGERGVMGKIGPNALLVFDVELLGIEPPEKPDKDAAGAVPK